MTRAAVEVCLVVALAADNVVSDDDHRPDYAGDDSDRTAEVVAHFNVTSEHALEALCPDEVVTVHLQHTRD